MAASSDSRRPAKRLLVALAALFAACLALALVERTLFSRSMTRSLEDSSTLCEATEVEASASRLTDEAQTAILSSTQGSLQESQWQLSRQLAKFEDASARLVSQPRWHGSADHSESLKQLNQSVLSIVAARTPGEAKSLLGNLTQRESAFDRSMRRDIATFSTDLSQRTADRLWWFGALFPGICACAIVTLTAIFLPPALRRIRSANDSLVELQAASANQASELEARNSDLQDQQQILRDHEAELIMKAEQLEAISLGSQQAARRFEELFQGLPVACVGFSEDGKIFEWNRASTELYCHDAYQVLHHPIWKHVAESRFRQRGASIVKQVFLGKEFKDVEWSYVRPDGQRRQVLGHFFPLRGIDGRILGGIASCLDVTDRKRAEDELRSSEKLFRDLIDSLHEGVLLYDQTGRIVVANHQAEVLLDAKRTALIGKRFEQVKPHFVGPDSEEFSPKELPYSRCLTTGEAIEGALVGLVQPGNEGNGVRWFSVNAIPLRRPNQESPHGVLSSFSEVTDRLLHEAQLKSRQGLLEEANTKLEALAVTDGLTGLFNHREFQERLSEQISAGMLPLSLVLLDVDLFKSYNDSFGHPEGDRVLRQVADILQAAVGEGGTAARYGGEEFAIILPGNDVRAATQFGDELCRKFTQASWPNRSITISAGIATTSDAGYDPAALIREADAALYASKRAGRDRSTHINSLETNGKAA